MADKKHEMTVLDGVYRVASETRLGVWWNVTLPTCDCPHFDRSRRSNADHDKHIIAALKRYLGERGYDVVAR